MAAGLVIQKFRGGLGRSRLRYNATDPINRRIEAWYPMNEGAGQAFTESLLPSQRPLEASGDAKLVSGNANGGKWGSSFGLNTTTANTCFQTRTGQGTSSSEMPAKWFTDSPTFTVSIQCYVNNAGTAFPVGWGSNIASQSRFTIRKDSSEAWQLEVGDSAGTATTTASAGGASSMNLGQWYHIIGRFDGTNAQIWQDSMTETNGPTAFAGTGSLALGSNTYNGFSFGGRRCFGTVQGEVDGGLLNGRYWGRALEDSEIQRLFIDPWAGAISITPFMVTATGVAPSFSPFYLSSILGGRVL